jgi:hypothetical protein
VQFERLPITPATVNIELAGHANRLEGLVADASLLQFGGMLNGPDRLTQRALATWASVEAGEEIELSRRSNSTIIACAKGRTIAVSQTHQTPAFAKTTTETPRAGLSASAF